MWWGDSPFVNHSILRVAVALEVFTCVGGKAPTTYNCQRVAGDLYREQRHDLDSIVQP